MRGRECLILLLQFVEQPDVLDGDDGLVREGLEQRQLPVGKGSYVTARAGDSADRLAVPNIGTDRMVRRTAANMVADS
jgi:hypothetical protein